MEHLPFKMSLFANTHEPLHWLRESEQDRATYA